jgi:orotate phosphoribosyltransferase
MNKGQVVDFLVQSQALKFGEFMLKSGRKAPYFINTGCFDNGEKISKLAHFYAEKLQSLGLHKADVVFGPAYKGIPLCVSTAIALKQHFDTNIGFSFNRKEVKTRGEGGEFVGTPLTKGMKVVLVEDVVTAGTTLQEVVPVLKEKVGVEVAGVVILVDRAERGKGTASAVQEAEKDLGIKIHPIVTISDIISYLSKPNSSGFQIDAALQTRIDEYRAEFGALSVEA